MAKLGLLCMKIFSVVLVLRHLDGYTLHNFKAVAFQPFDLARIVGQQSDLADAQVLENLCTDAVITQICGEAQLQVGIYRIQSFLLQLVGTQLVDQANPRPSWRI